jgi:hypothetical protein
MAVAWRKHDAGFFSLDLPADWVMRDPANGGGGSIVVHDQRGDLSLTFLAVSKPAGPSLVLPLRNPTAKEAQHELQKWLDTKKNIIPRHDPRLVPSSRHLTATTEAVERPAAPWYKRLFRRRPLRLWRFWAILNPHLLVLASSAGTPELLEKHRALLDRILLSLRLPERDLLLGRHFADKVVSLARSYFPELAVAIIDDAHLRCGSHPVSLMPLHRRYLAAPEDLPTHVKSFFAEVQSDLPASEVAHEWTAARQNILPTFIATANADVLGLAHEPWVNLLSIAYLLEDEGATGGGGDRPITLADVKRWRIDSEMLHEQALKNLVFRSHGHAMEVHKSRGEGDSGIGGEAGGGGYTKLLLVAPEKHNAVRILLPQLHSILREHLGTTFFAAIPTHEFLLAFSTTSEEVLNRVRQQIAADFSRAKNGVSPKIFLVTPDGITGDPTESEDLDL